MERQRIDKWLWHARIVRTRSAAASLAAGGSVRINGARIDAASRRVAPGDVVTVTLDRIRVLKVLDFSERRGSADAARMLYDDLTSPLVPPTAVMDAALPPSRAGRPTKQDRRAIDRWRKRNDL